LSVVRSLRRVLGRSRVIFLAALAVAVFFTAGFVELGVTRHSMQAQYEQARARVERTERQNTLLQLQLERAQRGELLPWLAWEMYGKLPKGARGIETQAPAPVMETGPVQPPEPQWQTWLKALGIN
jgi:hypothetical protein